MKAPSKLKAYDRAREIYQSFRKDLNIRDSLDQTEIHLRMETLVFGEYLLTPEEVHEIVEQVYQGR